MLKRVDVLEEAIEIPGGRVLRKLGEGYFGTTFLIQDEWERVQVFKTVRSAHLVPYLRREYELLQYLTAHPSLAPHVPRPGLWLREPPGFLMEYVPGTWLKDRALHREDLVHIAEFMGLVHQVDPQALRRMMNVAMPSMPYRRYVLEDFREARRFFLNVSADAHRSEVVPVLEDVIAHLSLLERHVEAMVPLFSHCAPAFVHGDVSPYNVCDTGQGIKVVDWGQCRIETRCADIARTFRWFLLNPDEEEVFWEIYGMQDPPLVEQVSAYGPVQAFYSLIYVMDRLRLAPDPEMHTEDVLAYLLAVFDTGRRHWERQKAGLGQW